MRKGSLWSGCPCGRGGCCRDGSVGAEWARTPTFRSVRWGRLSPRSHTRERAGYVQIQARVLRVRSQRSGFKSHHLHSHFGSSERWRCVTRSSDVTSIARPSRGAVGFHTTFHVPGWSRSTAATRASFSEGGYGAARSRGTARQGRPKIITESRSEGSTLTVTASPSRYGFAGSMYCVAVAW